jgi:DNA-binding NarL/FixJ family response regulator
MSVSRSKLTRGYAALLPVVMTAVLNEMCWFEASAIAYDSWRSTMRVLVVESLPHVRAALRFLLSRQSDIQLVGSIGAEPHMAAKLTLIAADVIVLDWALPQHTASHLLSVLRQLPDQPRTIVLSSWPHAQQAALAAGADAFVSKNDSPDTVLRMLRSIGIERQQPG